MMSLGEKLVMVVFYATLLPRNEGINVLTWNSGGGAPTPEYLGGPWEMEKEGAFSEIEKLTGVLLFEIAGCDVGGFAEGGKFEKYTRYKSMYEHWEDYAKIHEGAIGKIKERIALEVLLDGSEAVGGNKNMPEWGQSCTIDVIVGTSMGLCAKKFIQEPKGECDFGKEVTKDGEVKKTKFAQTEGCWKQRDALPVYGAKFMELYLTLFAKQKPPDMWTQYFESLQNQSIWEPKGCTAHNIKETDTDIKKTYPSPGGALTTDSDVKLPDVLRMQHWLMVAVWDVLLIRLMALASDILISMAIRLRKFEPPEKVITYLRTIQPKNLRVLEEHIAAEDIAIKPIITDGDVAGKIKELMTTAVGIIKPDVIFLQESPRKLEIDNYASRASADDTAIYMVNKNDVIGSIDDLGTMYAQTLYEILMGASKNIAEANQNEVLKVEHTKLTERNLKSTSEKQGEQNAEAQTKISTMDQRKKFTVVLTTNNLLLLSIHADGDGYFCARYLRAAVALYAAVQKDLGTKLRMVIGIDSNIQPPDKHVSYAQKKGFSYTELKELLPEGMGLMIPDHNTVLKVRSFLQTQFDKIGKLDDQTKDLLLEYPISANQVDQKAYVYNTIEGNTFKYLENVQGVTKFYPRVEWPVDHFMVRAECTDPEGDSSEFGFIGELVKLETPAKAVTREARARSVRNIFHRKIFHALRIVLSGGKVSSRR